MSHTTLRRSDAGQRLCYAILWRYEGQEKWITYGATWTNGWTLAEAERVFDELSKRPKVQAKIIRSNEWRQPNNRPRLGKRGARPVDW
jgi:hypothetical protein